MAGIYIHIPFCKQACYYCDFHFSTNQKSRAEVVNSIIKEIALQKDYLQQEPVNTIYFGGGTPSLLSSEELNALFESIRTHHAIAANAEITLEANPDDLSKEKLRELHSQGINRLSIGIQSFDDTILKFFHRTHNAKEAIQSVENAREAGFNNLSLDLIYAVPGQEHTQWKHNIQEALQLNPEHLSCYTLTIEDKTTFGKWSKTGKFNQVNEETAAQEFETLMHQLEIAGYEHYEISNFCKPGFHSRHNSNYWKQEKYLGLGPSAHSFNKESRQFNINNNTAYVKALEQNKLAFEKEQLSTKDKINEYILTSLRTIWGSNLRYLTDNHNYDLIAAQSAYLENIQKQGLIDISTTLLKLTRKGKLVADQIASDLFITT
jgi:oxygen-independent coproporphyrinogen III oxidase